jgi:hypothetical protein
VRYGPHGSQENGYKSGAKESGSGSGAKRFQLLKVSFTYIQSQRAISSATLRTAQRSLEFSYPPKELLKMDDGGETNYDENRHGHFKWLRREERGNLSKFLLMNKSLILS